MKKILIKAYAQLNLGDDLFIKMLCERYKDTEFYLFATPEYENLKGIESNNLKILYNDTFAKKILFRLGRKFGISNILEDLKVKELDGVVNIGGSIFIENDFSKEDFKSPLPFPSQRAWRGGGWGGGSLVMQLRNGSAICKLPI